MDLPPRTARFVGLLIAFAVWGVPGAFGADEVALPLHEEIDVLIEQRLAVLKIMPAKSSSDADFLRRVYLDLSGVIPTAEQARTFLADSAPNKRERLIDELLASPDYALHLARVFDVMLAERRIPAITSYDVPTGAWRAYLAAAFTENRPWDQMVREILECDGADAKSSGAVKFYLVRDVAPHQLTRDVGRLFLGRDLQCAQCHDDPRFDEYRQADYYGIYAFLQRVKLHPATPRGAQIGETAEGKTTFTSVFTAMSGETNPRLPGGEMIADPDLVKGKEYVVKPGPKERGIPTYSRRLKLAERLPRHETTGFSRNIANRLWAIMLGRGLVHPLDLHHAGNPPSHPELLDRLEQWLVDHKYDIKGLLREIALSRTYQRSSVLPAGMKEQPDNVFAVAPLRGLTAEQFRWSVLQATSRIEQHAAKFDVQQKKSPPAKSAEPQAAWQEKQARNEALERQSASLITAFAGLAGQTEGDFQPVVDQALFLRNSTKFLPLLQEEPGTLLARLGTVTDTESAAEELYLSVLSRRPTADETAEVRQLLVGTKTPAERREPLQLLLWGLLLSAEFRLNH